MRLAIMQPYFFPYLGYFDLLNSVDLFLVFDTVQYIRRGWMHRNRILHQSGKGWQYIIVPTQPASQKSRISEIQIVDTADWRQKLLGQLAHYTRAAPHAADVIRFVSDCLAVDLPSLSRLNVHLLQRVCDLLNLRTSFRFASDLNFDQDPEATAEQRILDLCGLMGANEYVNLPGGVDLYHPANFTSRNIKLTFRRMPPLSYETGPYQFEPNLSILDVLMWNTPERIKDYLGQHIHDS